MLNAKFTDASDLPSEDVVAVIYEQYFQSES